MTSVLGGIALSPTVPSVLDWLEGYMEISHQMAALLILCAVGGATVLPPLTGHVMLADLSVFGLVLLIGTVVNTIVVIAMLTIASQLTKLKLLTQKKSVDPNQNTLESISGGPGKNKMAARISSVEEREVCARDANGNELPPNHQQEFLAYPRGSPYLMTESSSLATRMMCRE